MAVGWPQLSLSEAKVSLIDCDHRTPPAAETGYAYVAIPQLCGGRIDLSDVRRITPEHFAEWTKKARPAPHDVVLSRRCNPGETAYVPLGLEFALGQNLVLLRADGSKIYPPFLRWLTRGPEWWDQIAKFLNVGAVFDSLKCADVPNFALTIPPLSDQRAIASILGALDDKIELNRRMNETLEAMARAVFKSWFVDFEPIPGLGPHNEWQDSPLGRIPKGWKVDPFSDTVEIFGGGTPKTSIPEYWGGDIPWFAVGDAPKGSDVCVIDTEKKITQAGVENSATRILPVGTTIITARGTVGKLALTGVPMAMNQTCYGLWGRIEKSSSYTYFSTLNLVTTLQQRTHGSVFDTITRDTLASVKVVSPLSKLIVRFEAEVSPIMGQILNNLRQSRTLSAMRDALLPKLLSGEIRVNNVEKYLEGTV